MITSTNIDAVENQLNPTESIHSAHGCGQFFGLPNGGLSIVLYSASNRFSDKISDDVE